MLVYLPIEFEASQIKTFGDMSQTILITRENPR